MERNPETNTNNKTMEEMLIETFGCIYPDKRAAKIHTDGLTRRIKTDFYLAGSAMETMLIEVFGCSSMNGNAIKFISDRDRKRINRKLSMDGNTDEQFTMPLSVSA
jgi:hypothetical protein